ncbi:gliding motility-associated C-terminal domain-containing protein [Tenacibaculum sp.]|uniref:T9SS type B sorting domain-containing protein n=1 Tax=Tenacibaculum sp. TaxID=1906242 RepID=UPI003D0DE8B3
MKKHTKSILVLLAILLFCVSSSVVSQVLETPIVANGEGKTCDQTGTTDFPLKITFTTAPFNDDNVFIIELSDENGSFADASKVKELRTLVSTGGTNYNQAFNIDTSFQLPEGTFGKNYKIRIRTTSPAMSQESDFFEAYHDMFAEGELIINGGNTFTLCNSETKEVTLNTTVIGEYLWYKVISGTTGTLVATTQEPKYTITEAGQYYVVVDYGKCGGPKSNYLTVSGLSGSDTQIKGATTVEICGSDTHTFEANVTNNTYTYNWYLDGNLVKSSNEYTYTTPNVGQFGTYRLEINAGTCTTVSNNVVLQQQTTAGFNVNTTGILKTIILQGETRDLCITHDASSGTVQWYKDGVSMGSAANQLCLSAVVAGVYFARVTESTGSSCDAVVDSEKYVLLGVKSFNATIRTETGYEKCNSSSTKLSIVGVKAIGEDDNEYDLTATQVGLLSYQWNKDGTPISGATSNELTIGSYVDSGLYTLTVSAGITNGNSNELDVKLVEVPQVTSSSVSNSLCAGGAITYTINNVIAGYTYQWIKDGIQDVTPADPQTLVVTEVGEYVLKYSGFGCNSELNPIVVVPFDDSAVTITPSEIVVMEAGSSATVVAAGGETYEWYEGEDNSGALLSTTEELIVTTLGFYTVYVKVGSCTVQRTIEVVEPDGQIIVPNIVSPNQDGINDTWKLSNSYAYQPSVQVILYNSNGKEILNTTDYKNDWPMESLGNQKIFYYKIIKDDKLMKAGTISVLD